MLALYCPRHGDTVLLDVGRISRVMNLDDGLIVVQARCYDGEIITVITGSRATLPPNEVGRPPPSSPSR